MKVENYIKVTEHMEFHKKIKYNVRKGQSQVVGNRKDMLV